MLGEHKRGQRMGRVCGMAAGTALAAVCLIALPAPAPAFPAAEADDTPFDKFYDEHGVGDVPGKYVFLLDTSRSLHSPDAGNLFEQEKAQLSVMLSRLNSVDQVTVIGFGDVPRVIFDGPAGRSPGEILKRLPELAQSDNYTNFGLAFQKAVEAFEGVPDGAAGALVFITDSMHWERAGKPYEHSDGQEWRTLIAEAAKLKRLALATYFVNLRWRPAPFLSHASDLLRIFPAARELPAEPVEGFRQPIDAVRLAKARSMIGPDMKARVTVAWPAGGEISPGANRIEATLTNTAKHLRLLISGLTVTTGSAGVTATLDTGVTTVSLGPGEQQIVPMTVVWHAGNLTPWPLRTVRLDGSVTIDGRIEAADSDVVKRDLGLVPGWELAGGYGTLTGAAQLGQPAPWVVGTGVLLILILVMVIPRRTSPRLIGRLQALVPGLDVADGYGHAYLTGRQALLPSHDDRLRGNRIDTLPGKAIVRGTRKPGFWPRLDAVLIEFWPENDRNRRVAASCEDRSFVIINGVEFRWDSRKKRANRRFSRLTGPANAVEEVTL